MIQYVEGNIFDSPAQVIVNTVNTVGVMGKGLALSFKQRYPDMFERYKAACEKRQLTIGKLMLFYEPDHWLLLFPTKENWRNPSKLEYIEKGLLKFVDTYADKNIVSIAFPRLGCGNGELDWNDVRPLMEKYLKPLPIDVYIYVGMYPEAMPEHKMPQKTIAWLKENAKDMSFNGVRDDLIVTSSIVPHEFQSLNECISVTYENGVRFSNFQGKQIEFVDEDDFYYIWDTIRQKSIFPEGDQGSKEELICAMLFSLGYLTKVRILDTKTNSMINGYQINEAVGRVFSFKEDRE